MEAHRGPWEGTPAPPPRVEAERRWLTALSVGAFALFGGEALLSPDGLQMFGLVRGWLGLPLGSPDTGHWPALWPLLVAPAVWLDQAEPLARGLNLILAGLVADPLHRLACDLAARARGPVGAGGRSGAADPEGPRWAGRLAVLAWMLWPAARLHAPVLDARPLAWLLCVAFAASLGRAPGGGRWAAIWASLGALARPELVALPVLLVGAQLWHRLPWRVITASLAIGLGPPLLLRVLRGGRAGWEVWMAPWYGVWDQSDLLGLYGAGAEGSTFRRFVLAAVEAGVERAPADPASLLRGLPHRLTETGWGLVGAVGLVGLVGGLGSWRSLPRAAQIGLLLPLVAIAISPMGGGQATPAANLIVFAPLAFAGLGAATMVWLGEGRRGPERATFRAVGLAFVLALVALESGLAVYVPAPPRFAEGGLAARQAVALLRVQPPPALVGGPVARSVAFRAGVPSAALPNRWEAGAIDASAWVLLSSADEGRNSGGRAAALLTDGRWEARWLLDEATLAAWTGQRAEGPAWFVLLAPAAAPGGRDAP